MINQQKMKASYGKRSLLFRTIAIVVSLALFVGLVSDADLTMHARASEKDFNVYTYIADNILSENTSANSKFSFYYGSFKSNAQIWSNSMTKEFADSVRAWETINVALDPSSAFDKPIDVRGYYVSIIFDMLQVSYGDTDLLLDKLLNKNAENGSKIYTSFAKAFKDYSNMDLDAYLKKTEHTEDEEALLETVQKKYLQDNKFVTTSQSIDDLLKAIKTGKKVEEYTETFLSYCALADINNEWYTCVKKMRSHCDSSNTMLCSALDIIIDQMETDDIKNAIYQTTIDVAQEGGTYLLKKGIDKMWESLTGPVGKAINWGQAIGGSISNFLFGTDKTIEAYYTVNAYCIVMDLFKKSFEDIKQQYLSNPTTENAVLFLRSIDLYFNLLKTGEKFGMEFTDVMYNGGVANLLFRSQGEYEKSKELSEYYLRSIEDAHTYIMGSWLVDLYNDDTIPNNIDLYNDYTELIDNINLDEVSYIPVGSVKFEKDSVEWGLNDYEYQGCECTVSPDKATVHEVIYTTTDGNVAEITSSGDVRVNGVGTCTITATSADNEDIYDTLSVTVVEGKGADSLSIDEVNIITPSAEQETQQSVLYFNLLSNDTYEVFGLDDEILQETLTDVTIPPYYNGKKVTAIGRRAFRGYKLLSSVTIPETIVKIDWRAFQDCTNLRTIVIPKNVRTIENGTFDGCTALKSVTLPEGLTMLGTTNPVDDGTSGIYWGVFKNCTSLTSITIPQSTVIIGNYAFSGCTNLKSVTIPKNVSTIGTEAFRNCKSIKSIIMPDNVIKIGDYAFEGCQSLSEVVLNNEVTYLGKGAFENCDNLNHIEIPNSIIELYDETFAYCDGLETVILPDTLTTISGNFIGAFYECTSLKSITIPNSVTFIGETAFLKCNNLISVVIPENVKIANGFKLCSGLKYAVISEGVKSIGGSDSRFDDNGAFYGCGNLRYVVIPKSVVSIEMKAFYNCDKLTDVYYAGSETEWNNITIETYNDALKNATIHYNTTTPPDKKYDANITIPQTVGSSVDSSINVSARDILGNTIELSVDENGSINISDIADGNYTFTFSADNCASRDYDVTIENGDLSGLENGVELRLYGDIDDTGDGIVDIRDVAKANMYYKTGEGLSGYMLNVSDVNSDNVIDIRDIALMNAHFKQTGNLWE